MKTDPASTPQGELRMPCRWCQQPTPKATLAHLGARCQACFDRYCASPPPAPHVPGPIPGGPKRWAYALRAREQGGEPLSRLQRAAWREVIGEGAHQAEVDGDVIDMPLALPPAIPLPSRTSAITEAEAAAMGGEGW